MKKRINYCFLFLFLLPFSNRASATGNVSPNGIYFSGMILDHRLLENPGFKSQIHIYASQYPFSKIDIGSLPHERYDIDYKTGDTFSIHIPNKVGNIYLNVSYDLPKKYISTYNWIDNMYLFSNGDSVFCKLSDDKKSRIFTGRGAVSLQCQVDIYNLKYNPTGKEWALLNSPDTYLSGLNEIYKRQDSALWLQLNVINKNKQRLDSGLTRTLLANCIGLQYYSFLRGLYIGRLNDTAFLHEFMKSNLYKNIRHIDFKDTLSSNVANAPIFSSFIFQREVINALIAEVTRDISPDSSRFRRLYNFFSHNYAGAMREKMITYLILHYSRSTQDAILLLNEELLRTKTEIYRRALEQIRNAKGIGKDLGSFILTDVSGNAVRLSDFPDKVLVLDFWYTGCSPCMKLNKDMEPVYKCFAGNSKIIFVSISIDKSKDVWRKSVRGGKYTNPQGLHLFTGGLGSSHPIIKATLINSYPTMFILVDGKLFSSAPPKPGTKSDRDGLIELIRKAVGSL